MTLQFRGFCTLRIKLKSNEWLVYFDDNIQNKTILLKCSLLDISYFLNASSAGMANVGNDKRLI